MKLDLKKLFVASIFVLGLLTVGNIFAAENLPPYDGQNFGGIDCSNTSGGWNTCYFYVPVNDISNYQAYIGIVDVVFDSYGSNPDSSVIIDVCLSHTTSWSILAGCREVYRTPQANRSNPPDVRINRDVEIGDLGNYADPLGYAAFRISIDDGRVFGAGYAEGRRVHINSLDANPTSISSGQSSQICWTTTNVPNGSLVVLRDDAGNVISQGGSINYTYPNCPTVSPTRTTTYTLYATGPGGSGQTYVPPATVEKSTTVTVVNQPTGTIRSDWQTCTKNTLSNNPNCDVVLNYTTQNATAGNIRKNGTSWRTISANVLPSGTQVDSNPAPGTYTYALYGSNNDFTEAKLDETTVTINPAATGTTEPGPTTTATSPPVTNVSCTASAYSVQPGATSTLTASGGDGANYTWSVSPSGANITPLNGSTTSFSSTQSGVYEVTATSGGRSGLCTMTVESSAPQTCQDPTADNYGSALPCQFTAKPINVNGYLDKADCESIGGWALDPDTKPASTQVKVNSNLIGEIYNATTDVLRTDVNAAYGSNGYHGFTFLTPDSVKDGRTHSIAAYGYDPNVKSWKQLNTSPKSLQCPPPTPAPSCTGGSVNVTTNQQSPIYTITKPDNTTFSGAGTRLYSPVSPCGTYTIQPSALSGYTVSVSPSTSRPLNANGQTIDFNITYTAISGNPPQQNTTTVVSCSVDVGSPNPNNPGSVTVTEPNYCVTGPGGTVTWSYSDPQGSPQSAYQVQVDDQGSFNSPEVDSGQINSGSGSYAMPSGRLGFNITYRARVRVWNNAGGVSNWSTSPSWKTPTHAYPNANAPYQFSWTPPTPIPTVPVQFSDRTWFDGSSNNKQWRWTASNGQTSTQQNPQFTFATAGTYQVTEEVRDNAMPSGQYCTGPTQTINVKKPVPTIKEVPPR